MTEAPGGRLRPSTSPPTHARGMLFPWEPSANKRSKPDEGFVYLVVLETSLQFERDGPAAIEDAGFGGSGRSLPSNDNIKASEPIWPVTSKIEQVYI